MAVPYLDKFVTFTSTQAPGLFTSDVIQSGASVFTEFGNQLVWLFQTAPMQDDGGMFEGSATLSVMDMQLPHIAQAYTFVASDVDNGVLSLAQITTSPTGAIWNGFTWGTGIWTSQSYGFERYNIPWTNPLVFSRLVIQANGNSVFGLKLGKLTVGNEPTNYVRIL